MENLYTRSGTKVSDLFFVKTWWILMKRVWMRWPWTFICMRKFFAACQVLVDGKQHLSEVVFSALVGFLLHHEYASHGQTITKEYYRHVLHRLRDAVRHKRLDLWSTGNWRLHHYNALAHPSHLIQAFLAKNQTPVVRQAPYSPDRRLRTSL